MEVVNKNVESKNKTLEYLNSLKIDARNMHTIFEFNNFSIAIVMIETTNLSNEKTDYLVNVFCIDKIKEIVYNNLMSKNFINYVNAKNYYNELIDKFSNINENGILELLESIK